jgi:hypothetical protein
MHHVEVVWVPHIAGVQFVCFAKLDGGRLTLNTGPMICEGLQQTHNIVWHNVE